MLIASPLTRKAHLVILALPAAGAAACFFRGLGPADGRARRALAVSAAVALAVALLSSRDIVGREVERWLRAHTVIFFVPLALWIGGIVALGREPTAAPQGRSHER
jgi:hypothetical protein